MLTTPQNFFISKFSRLTLNPNRLKDNNESSSSSDQDQNHSDGNVNFYDEQGQVNRLLDSFADKLVKSNNKTDQKVVSLLKVIMEEQNNQKGRDVPKKTQG